MYTFVITDQVLTSIQGAITTATSIPEKLENLANNPLSKAKKTGIPAIGDYYVNAGRYCILFSLDEEHQKIKIFAIVLSAYLYKILIGKMDQPENPLASVITKALHH